MSTQHTSVSHMIGIHWGPRSFPSAAPQPSSPNTTWSGAHYIPRITRTHSVFRSCPCMTGDSRYVASDIKALPWRSRATRTSDGDLWNARLRRRKIDLRGC